MTTVPAKKGLGLWMVTSLVTGNMIGSGVFLLPSTLAHYGSIGLLAWALTSVGATILALVFARFAALMPRVGGPYAYCRAGFGDFVGFQVAYNYWIATCVGNAAIVVALVGYITVFVPILATNHFDALLVGLALLWGLTYVNIVGVREAGWIQLVTTILKLIPIGLIAIVGLFHLQPHYLTAFNTTGHSHLWALNAAAIVTFWSFVGVESATIPADDVVDAKRNIPRATILGTVIAAAVYVCSATAIMGLVPMDVLAQSTAPFADAAGALFGSAGRWIIAVGAIIACFGTLNGWLLMQGHIPLAAANDGLFPAFFAKRAESGTPITGLVVSSGIISVLLFMNANQSLVDEFTIIILLATLASVIPYMITALALIMTLIKDKSANLQQLRASIVVAVMAAVYGFWLVMGAGEKIVYYGMLLFLSGIFVYVWLAWQARKRMSAVANQPVDAPILNRASDPAGC